MTEEPASLASIVRRLRDARHWSAVALARRCGLSREVIGRIERGESQNPNMHTLLALADAFGVSVDALMGRVPLPEDRDANRCLPRVWIDILAGIREGV